MMNIEELGSHLRARRKELGVDQLTLSELSGVSVHTLSNIESGKGNPTFDVLVRVLDVLGLELKLDVPRPGDD